MPDIRDILRRNEPFIPKGPAEAEAKEPIEGLLKRESVQELSALPKKKMAKYPVPGDEELSSMNEIAEGLVSTSFRMASTVGTGVQFVGERLGFDPMSELGKETYNYWENLARGLAPHEDIAMNLTDDWSLINPATARGRAWLGRSVAEMTPALAATILAGAVYLPLSFVVGGLMEAAPTYQEALDRGMTENSAAARSSLMFVAAGLLNRISVGKALSKGAFGKLRKFISTGAVESLTEYAEEPAEGIILGEDWDTFVERLKRGVDVLPAAFLTGGLGGVVVDVARQTEVDKDAAEGIEAITGELEPIVEKFGLDPFAVTDSDFNERKGFSISLGSGKAITVTDAFKEVPRAEYNKVGTAIKLLISKSPKLMSNVDRIYMLTPSGWSNFWGPESNEAALHFANYEADSGIMRLKVPIKPKADIYEYINTIAHEAYHGKQRYGVLRDPSASFDEDIPTMVGEAAEKYFKGFKEKAKVHKPKFEDPLSNEARAFLDAQREALEEKSRTYKWKGFKKKLKTITYDASANVKQALIKQGGALGEEAAMRFDLIKGANPAAAKVLTTADKNIYKGLAKKEVDLLNDIIFARATLNVMNRRPDMLRPGALKKEHWENLLRDVPQTIPKELNDKLQGRSDIYFDEWRSMLDFGLIEGLISEDSYTRMMDAGIYSPRDFIQHIDPERAYTTKEGKKVTVRDSGFMNLEEGSEEFMESNSRLLLGQGWTRLYNRAFKQRANETLLRLAATDPDNGVVMEAGMRGKELEKAPKGFDEIDLFVRGEEARVFMPSELAREWSVGAKAVDPVLANAIGWLSGSKILKATATGYNPGFALTNFPRDLALIWASTTEYSANPFKAVPQMGADLLSVATDAFRRKGAFNDYIDEGGGMDFLSHQGRMIHRTRGRIKLLQDILGYAGETSEIWTRLAIRNRALKNNNTRERATYIARNYLDFAQGGTWAKAADSGIPYLNASIQATRAIFRGAKNNPGVFTQKMAWLGMTASGLALANLFTNRDAWEEISDDEKMRYFIFTSPWTYKDKQGNKRHLYFRIAKDQGQRAIATLFEGFSMLAAGEKVRWNGLVDAVREIIPLMPDESLLPPTLDALLGYRYNINFWQEDKIWKGLEVADKSLEFTKYTQPGLVDIGAATGMSPERLQYALQQVFARGNMYSYVVGGALKELIGNVPGEQQEQVMEEMLTSMPIIRRVLRTSYVDIHEREELEKLGLEANNRSVRQRGEMNGLCQTYVNDKSSGNMKAITAYISSQPREDWDRLKSRFRNYGRTYNMPHRSWWLEVAQLDPETRAAAVYGRWSTSTPKEKKDIEAQLHQLPSIRSERFDRTYRSLVGAFNRRSAP